MSFPRPRRHRGRVNKWSRLFLQFTKVVKRVLVKAVIPQRNWGFVAVLNLFGRPPGATVEPSESPQIALLRTPFRGLSVNIDCLSGTFGRSDVK